jgi:putative transposase
METLAVPRRDVELLAGEYYHIYNRGNNRQPIFYERSNYLFFLKRMREYLCDTLDIVAYCLMPTHYHLLVRIKPSTAQPFVLTSEASKPSQVSLASRAMMRLAVSYTKAINKRFERVGALFQGPIGGKHLDRTEYLVHLSRYTHLNPLTASLVKRAEEWEFSSYRDYLGLRQGTLPSPDVVLSQFPSPEAYQQFVESYVAPEREVIGDLLFD